MDEPETNDGVRGPPTPKERQTIEAAQRGSEDAVEALARELWRQAYAAAFAMVAEHAAASDIAQESVLKALAGLDGFDSRRSVRPWMNRITTNAALDWLRSERRHGHAELRDEPSPERQAGRPGALLELVDALRNLDPDVRAMVVLRHLGGFDSNEIAEIVRSKPATVRSRISRALADMRTSARELVEEGSAQ